MDSEHRALQAARLIEEILQAAHRGDDRRIDTLLARLAQVGKIRDLFALRERLYGLRPGLPPARPPAARGALPAR
ncbi:MULTISPECIES: hypothetical protein [Streptomyces]|uniref:hypothetical protein n=1 Tax=Streptomyces TaxID=1883 RepID=UPI0016742FD2|nr:MULTISPECIES: hypothetical protein [Streptomyces]MBD3579464.1 hypothetical protein [Streptomyces sp. KD18]